MNRLTDFGYQIEIAASFFESRKLDYALVGALALHAYGYSRTTLDIDIITRCDYKPDLIRMLETNGYDTIHSSEGYSNHIMQGSIFRFDFLYIDGVTADEIFQAATYRIEMNRHFIPVVSAKHLIATKVFAIRNDPDRKLKDLADIKELLRLNPIDPSSIKKYFEDYGLTDLFNEVADASDK